MHKLKNLDPLINIVDKYCLSLPLSKFLSNVSPTLGEMQLYADNQQRLVL